MTDQTIAEPSTKIAKIEDRLDRNTLADVAATGGGVQFRTMTEVMEFSKLMSLAGVAVPPHLRGNPGTCLAVCIQAMEWRMSPFAVANKSYAVMNKGVERIAYESQLIHAVIEARAPLQERLRVSYEGEGDNRVCIVSGLFKGETEPRILKSPTLGLRRPGKNESGQIKGSPLWGAKPDLQQFYDTSRDWCRMYCPDVLMGIYSQDEFEESALAEIEQKDVSPNLMERLPGKIEGAGFAHDVVENGIADKQKADPVADAVKTVEAAKADEETETIPFPTNRKEYEKWVDQWLTKANDADQIAERWRSERKLRNTCGLISEETAEIKAKVDAKIKTLK